MLGSGLGELINHLSIKRSVSFNDFVDFKIKSLDGHERAIHEASIEDQSLIIISGKLHLYEGYTYSQCIAPLRHVAENYTITKWIITSASGSLNDDSKVGQWQKISSLLTLENIPQLSSSYSVKIPCTSNGKIYAFQKGPSLGTVAEYRMLRKFGADIIGMSMLPESIFLTSLNSNIELYSLPVCSYSSLDYNIVEPTHEEVISVAKKGVLNLLEILKREIKD